MFAIPIEDQRQMSSAALSIYHTTLSRCDRLERENAELREQLAKLSAQPTQLDPGKPQSAGAKPDGLTVAHVAGRLLKSPEVEIRVNDDTVAFFIDDAADDERWVHLILHREHLFAIMRQMIDAIPFGNEQQKRALSLLQEALTG